MIRNINGLAGAAANALDRDTHEDVQEDDMPNYNFEEYFIPEEDYDPTQIEETKERCDQVLIRPNTDEVEVENLLKSAMADRGKKPHQNNL